MLRSMWVAIAGALAFAGAAVSQPALDWWILESTTEHDVVASLVQLEEVQLQGRANLRLRGELWPKVATAGPQKFILALDCNAQTAALASLATYRADGTLISKTTPPEAALVWSEAVPGSRVEAALAFGCRARSHAAGGSFQVGARRFSRARPDLAWRPLAPAGRPSFGILDQLSGKTLVTPFRNFTKLDSYQSTKEGVVVRHVWIFDDMTEEDSETYSSPSPGMFSAKYSETGDSTQVELTETQATAISGSTRIPVVGVDGSGFWVGTGNRKGGPDRVRTEVVPTSELASIKRELEQIAREGREREEERQARSEAAARAVGAAALNLTRQLQEQILSAQARSQRSGSADSSSGATGARKRMACDLQYGERGNPC